MEILKNGKWTDEGVSASSFIEEVLKGAKDEFPDMTDEQFGFLVMDACVDMLATARFMEQGD